jgi:hypothetical protein
VSVFPRTFLDGSAERRAALVMDLLLDPEHRTFWSATRLVRRMIADLRQEGGWSFAYGDPVRAAQAVVMAAGLREIGAFDRFVFPLVGPYVTLRRVLSRSPIVSARWVADPDQWTLDAIGAGSYFAGRRSPDLYATRYQSGDGSGARWLELRLPGRSTGVAGLALTLPQAGRVLRVLDLRWNEELLSAEGVLLGVVRAAREAGFGKLDVQCLRPSEFANRIRRAGFIARGSVLPIYMVWLGDAADRPDPRRWLLTSLDSSAW